MDRSRDVLRMATFSPLILMRKEDGGERSDTHAEPTRSGECEDTREVAGGNYRRDTISKALALLICEDPHEGSLHPGAHREEAGDGDGRNVTLIRPDLRPQTLDHRGNFFRLPLHGLTDKNDPLAIAPDPLLRLRQDRRIEILAQSEFGSPPEPVARKKGPEPLTQRDPGREQPGSVFRLD